MAAKCVAMTERCAHPPRPMDHGARFTSWGHVGPMGRMGYVLMRPHAEAVHGPPLADIRTVVGRSAVHHRVLCWGRKAHMRTVRLTMSHRALRVANGRLQSPVGALGPPAEESLGQPGVKEGSKRRGLVQHSLHAQQARQDARVKTRMYLPGGACFRILADEAAVCYAQKKLLLGMEGGGGAHGLESRVTRSMIDSEVGGACRNADRCKPTPGQNPR